MDPRPPEEEDASITLVELALWSLGSWKSVTGPGAGRRGEDADRVRAAAGLLGVAVGRSRSGEEKEEKEAA